MVKMTGKEARKTKLERAPLIHVLAQVRFTPVLTIDRAVPVIQEQLRDLGFPRLEKNLVQRIVFGQANPSFDSVERWDFLTRDKKTGVVLTREFVILHTSSYDTFLVFADAFARVLEIISTQTVTSIVERLGIRYVDLVRLGDKETFLDYLQPGLAGFPFGKLADNAVVSSLSTTSSIATTRNNSTLVIKSIQSNSGQFLPPDLSPSVLKYDITLRPEEVVTVLDFDHYETVDLDFKPPVLIERLDALHRVANDAFREAVTPEALKRWGGS